MKKILFILFLNLNFNGYCQHYQNVIDSLDHQITIAAENKEYKIAGELQEKRDLYRKLDEAVNKSDFNEAQRLQGLIEGDSELQSIPEEKKAIDKKNEKQVHYFDNKYDIVVEADFPGDPKKTEINNAFVKQVSAISNIDDNSYQIVNQKSTDINIVKALENQLNGKATGLIEYRVGKFKVEEFDFEWQDNMAKFKVAHHKKGMIWLQVTSQTHMPTLFEVKDFFESFKLDGLKISIN